MARKPNYSFEKNQRARAKAAKREAKRQAKLEAKAKKGGESAIGEDGDEPPTDEALIAETGVEPVEGSGGQA